MTELKPTAVLDGILADILDLKKVADNLAAENCESWDSANHLRIILSLEETLGIQFTIAEIEAATSRKRLVDIISGKSATD